MTPRLLHLSTCTLNLDHLAAVEWPTDHHAKALLVGGGYVYLANDDARRLREALGAVELPRAVTKGKRP